MQESMDKKARLMVEPEAKARKAYFENIIASQELWLKLHSIDRKVYTPKEQVLFEHDELYGLFSNLQDFAAQDMQAALVHLESVYAPLAKQERGDTAMHFYSFFVQMITLISYHRDLIARYSDRFDFTSDVMDEFSKS